MKRMAMIRAKIAITIQSSKKMINKKRVLTLLLTTLAAKSPMDLPLALRDTTNAPKSWTAPKKIAPKKIQITAGTQPHMIAIAGPTMGPKPAIDVKWCPKRISFLVGTKSWLS